MNASNEYHFTTTWRVPGSAEEIFDLLGDALALPRWWPAVYLDVRDLIPLPPGPTTNSPMPFVLAGTAAALLLARVLRALGPRRAALIAGLGLGYLVIRVIRRNQAE